MVGVTPEVEGGEGKEAGRYAGTEFGLPESNLKGGLKAPPPQLATGAEAKALDVEMELSVS